MDIDRLCHFRTSLWMTPGPAVACSVCKPTMLLEDPLDRSALSGDPCQVTRRYSDIFSLFFGMFDMIFWVSSRARPGPLKRAWVRPGPLKSGKSIGKTHHLFSTHFYENKFVLGIQTAFFNSFNVLLSFLAEK